MVYLGDRGNCEVNGEVLCAAELMRELTGMWSGGSSVGGGGKPLGGGRPGEDPSPCPCENHRSDSSSVPSP